MSVWLYAMQELSQAAFFVVSDYYMQFARRSTFSQDLSD